jgi:putative membrane protein
LAASDTSGETGGNGTGASDTGGTTGADGSSAGDSGAVPGWKASRTRDHLANERTYLAWLRTAANVMVLGLAIARLIGHGGTRSLAAGVVLVTVGAAGLVYGAVRYRRVNVEIEQGTPVTRIGVGGPMIAAAVLIASIAAVLALLTVP